MPVIEDDPIEARILQADMQRCARHLDVEFSAAFSFPFDPRLEARVV